MALRVFQFACKIPAATPQAAPVTVPIAIDNWQLQLIDLEVPAGASGLMGFYVANNGVQWIPATPGAYLVWDNVQQSWYMEDQPNASGWSVVGYNTGYYDHTVTIRMHVVPPPVTSQPGGGQQVTFVTSNTPASEVVTLY